VFYPLLDLSIASNLFDSISRLSSI